MPINWPGAFTHGGNLPEEVQEQTKSMLDELGELVVAHLAAIGLPAHTSPLCPAILTRCSPRRRPSVSRFSPASGLATINWLDHLATIIGQVAMVDLLENQLGRETGAVVTLPLPIAAPERRFNRRSCS